jgi:hypothetical protein
VRDLRQLYATGALRPATPVQEFERMAGLAKDRNDPADPESLPKSDLVGKLIDEKKLPQERE